MEKQLSSTLKVYMDLGTNANFSPTIITPPMTQEGVWAFYVSDFRMDLLRFQGVNINPWGANVTRFVPIRQRIFPFQGFALITTDSTDVLNEKGQPTGMLLGNVLPINQKNHSGVGYDINLSYRLDSKGPPKLCLLSGSSNIRINIVNVFTGRPPVVSNPLPNLRLRSDNPSQIWSLIICIMNLVFVRLK